MHDLVLEKAGLFIRKGEPYLTDDELLYSIRKMNQIEKDLRSLGNYGLATRILIVDGYALELIACARNLHEELSDAKGI